MHEQNQFLTFFAVMNFRFDFKQNIWHKEGNIHTSKYQVKIRVKTPTTLYLHTQISYFSTNLRTFFVRTGLNSVQKIMVKI